MTFQSLRDSDFFVLTINVDNYTIYNIKPNYCKS